MITAERNIALNEEPKFSFMGLSTDNKPTVTWKGIPIENSSTFFEMDTQAVKFYDAENATWV